MSRVGAVRGAVKAAKGEEKVLIKDALETAKNSFKESKYAEKDIASILRESGALERGAYSLARHNFIKEAIKGATDKKLASLYAGAIFDKQYIVARLDSVNPSLSGAEVNKIISNLENKVHVFTKQGDLDRIIKEEITNAVKGRPTFSLNPWIYVKNRVLGRKPNLGYEFGLLSNAAHAAESSAKSPSFGLQVKSAAKLAGYGVAGAAAIGAAGFLMNNNDYDLPVNPNINTPDGLLLQYIITPDYDNSLDYSNLDDYDLSNAVDALSDMNSTPKIKRRNSIGGDWFNKDTNSFNDKLLKSRKSNISNNFFNYTKDNSILDFLSLYHGLYN